MSNYGHPSTCCFIAENARITSYLGETNMKKISSRLLPLSLALLLLTSCGGGGDSSDTETSTAESSTSSSSVETPVGSSSSSSSEAEQEDDPPVIEEDQNEIVSIEISSRSSHRVDFELNKRFHHGGLVIETVTRGGKKEETNDFTVDSSAYKADTIGTYKINVKLNSNNNVSLSYDVRVVNVTTDIKPVSMKISAESSYVTTYIEGERYSLKGLYFDVTYSNNEVMKLPGEYANIGEVSDSGEFYSDYRVSLENSESEKETQNKIAQLYLSYEDILYCPITIEVISLKKATPTSLRLLDELDRTHLAFTEDGYEPGKSAAASTSLGIKFKETGEREITLTAKSSGEYWSFPNAYVAVATSSVTPPSAPGAGKITFACVNDNTVTASADIYWVDISSESGPTKLAFAPGYSPLQKYYRGEKYLGYGDYKVAMYFGENYIDVPVDYLNVDRSAYNPYAPVGTKADIVVSCNAFSSLSFSYETEIIGLGCDIAGTYGIAFNDYLALLKQYGDKSFGEAASNDFRDVYLKRLTVDNDFVSPEGDGIAEIGGTKRSVLTGIRSGDKIYYSTNSYGYTLDHVYEGLIYDISTSSITSYYYYGYTFEAHLYDENKQAEFSLTNNEGITTGSYFAPKGTPIPSYLSRTAEDNDFYLSSSYSPDGSIVESNATIDEYENVYYMPKGQQNYTGKPFVGRYGDGDALVIKLYDNGVITFSNVLSSYNLMLSSFSKMSYANYIATELENSPGKWNIKISSFNSYSYSHVVLTFDEKSQSLSVHNEQRPSDLTYNLVTDNKIHEVKFVDESKDELGTLLVKEGTTLPKIVNIDGDFYKITTSDGLYGLITGDTVVSVKDIETFYIGYNLYGTMEDSYYIDGSGMITKANLSTHEEFAYEVVDYLDKKIYLSIEGGKYSGYIDQSDGTLTIDVGEGEKTYKNSCIGDYSKMNGHSLLDSWNYYYFFIGKEPHNTYYNLYFESYGNSAYIYESSTSSDWSSCLLYSNIVYAEQRFDESDGSIWFDFVLASGNTLSYNLSANEFSIEIEGVKYVFAKVSSMAFAKSYYGSISGENESASIRFGSNGGLNVDLSYLDENSEWQNKYYNFQITDVIDDDGHYTIYYYDCNDDDKTIRSATYNSYTACLSIKIDGKTYSFTQREQNILYYLPRLTEYSWSCLNDDCYMSPAFYKEKCELSIWGQFKGEEHSRTVTYKLIDFVYTEEGYKIIFDDNGQEIIGTYNKDTFVFKITIDGVEYSFSHSFPLREYDFLEGQYCYSLLDNEDNFFYVDFDYGPSYFNIDCYQYYVENIEKVDGGYKISMHKSNDDTATAIYNESTLTLTVTLSNGKVYVYQKVADEYALYYKYSGGKFAEDYFTFFNNCWFSPEDENVSFGVLKGRVYLDEDCDDGYLCLLEGFIYAYEEIDNKLVIKYMYNNQEQIAYYDPKTERLSISVDGKDYSFIALSPLYGYPFQVDTSADWSEVTNNGATLMVGQCYFFVSLGDDEETVLPVTDLIETSSGYELTYLYKGAEQKAYYDKNTLEFKTEIDGVSYVWQREKVVPKLLKNWIFRDDEDRDGVYFLDFAENDTEIDGEKAYSICVEMYLSSSYGPIYVNDDSVSIKIDEDKHTATFSLTYDDKTYTFEYDYVNDTVKVTDESGNSVICYR